MNNLYIKHTVVDMDESMVQRCVLCGEVISDYRNSIAPEGTPPLKGWAAGDIYVSERKNPRTTMTVEPDNFKPCI